MECMIATQNAEEEFAAARMEDGVVPSVADWELLVEEEHEGGDADPATAREDGKTDEVQYEMRKTKVQYTKAGKAWSKAALYQLFLKLEIGGTCIKSNSGKRAVFDSIRDSDKVTKLNEDAFEFEEKVIPSHLQKGPKWKLLTGMEVTLPEGISLTGVEDGFYGPTNRDNFVGPPKLSYLTDAPIKRPSFKPKAKKNKEETTGS